MKELFPLQHTVVQVSHLYSIGLKIASNNLSLLCIMYMDAIIFYCEFGRLCGIGMEIKNCEVFLQLFHDGVLYY